MLNRSSKRSFCIDIVGCRFRFLDGAAVKGLSCLSNHAFIFARSASLSSSCGEDFLPDGGVASGAGFGGSFGGGGGGGGSIVILSRGVAVCMPRCQSPARCCVAGASAVRMRVRVRCACVCACVQQSGWRGARLGVVWCWNAACRVPPPAFLDSARARPCRSRTDAAGRASPMRTDVKQLLDLARGNFSQLGVR